MKRASTFVLFVTIAVAAAVFTSIPVRSTIAQAPKQAGGEGRYQVVLGGGTPAPCVVIDTTTGQCWLRSATGWDDLGSPTKPKK